MKVHLFGTSHGYAEKGRLTSCSLVEVNGKLYIIDVGGPADAFLVDNGYDHADVRGIFITHMHSDHAGSISGITEAFTRYRFNDKVTCLFPEEQGLEGFFAWQETLHGNRDILKKTTNYGVTQPGVCYEDENVKITAVPTLHLGGGKAPAFAYVIEAEGKTVIFSGDMASGFPEYEDVFGDRHYDLAICEMAHSALKDVKDKLKNTNTDKMIINHYHTPMVEGYEEIFKEFSFDVSLATDGLVINL